MHASVFILQVDLDDESRLKESVQNEECVLHLRELAKDCANLRGAADDQNRWCARRPPPRPSRITEVVL